MTEEALLERLTAVKGIGVWPVHMFMLFSMHGPDVLPVGDLGVRKGVNSLYELNGLPEAAEMEKVCEKWWSYRSVEDWYMWRLVDANVAAGKAATNEEALSLLCESIGYGLHPSLVAGELEEEEAGWKT
ncbi:unnamed protein product [Linum trigynum]|uniref:Uncharacterized protein n=1 Tax=Linum trigynum TaxID=586398 RepID=A0AAV2CVA6_9ROSI